jgi:hypothetical protein
MFIKPRKSSIYCYILYCTGIWDLSSQSRINTTGTTTVLFLKANSNFWAPNAATISISFLFFGGGGEGASANDVTNSIIWES